MSNQGNLKGSNEGPNNRDNKESENKLNKTRTILAKSDTSKIFLQSWALNKGVFKTGKLQSCK